MRIIIPLVVVAAIAGCKQSPELPAAMSPYRIDIQQGNVVTQEMVGKLKAGLTRSQVRFVLGSPLVTDMFHSDRWDYIYLLQRQGRPDERRRLTVIFDGDLLLRLEGDVVLTDKAQEPEQAKPPGAPAPKGGVTKPATAPPPQAKPEAGKSAAKAPVAAVPVANPGGSDASPASAPKSVPGKAAVAVPATAPDSKTDAAKAETKVEAAPAAAKADAPKSDAAVADEKKEAPKRGMFGRMLDKIGF